MLNVLHLVTRLPLPAQTAIGIAVRALPLEVTHGRTFNRTLRFLRQSEHWGADELRAYQLHALRALLEHAGETVPYYRALFRRHRFSPERLRRLRDLEILPLLSKEQVRADRERLRSEQVPDLRVRYVTTGGSTGEPLGFWIDRTASLREWAFMVHQWARVGYRALDRRAVLRGVIVQSVGNHTPWRYQPLRNEVVLSSFDLTPDAMASFVEVIERLRPRFLHAYPSSATVFGRYLRNAGIRLRHRFKAILAGSENIYPEQRELMEEVFGCRVFTWYGLSEKVLLGGECECSTAYHMFPQYGYLEIVDESGNTLHEDGITGEIVGTGFLNRAMPMIRYRTGDLGRLRTRPCECGRAYPLIERVEGRVQELLVGREG